MSILQGYMEMSVLDEAVKVLEYPSGKIKRYKTNLSYSGIPVGIKMKSTDPIYSEDDEKLKEILNNLERDFKIFKKGYPAVENSVFEKYIPGDPEWEMEDITTLNQIKAIAKLSSVVYYPWKEDKNTFTMFYNDGKNRNEKFYGGHCLIVEVNITNGKVELSRDSIGG